MMNEETLDFEINFYRNILRDQPEHFEALTALASALTQKGLYNEGLEIDRKLSELYPDDETVQYNLACSLALTGKKEEAVEVLLIALDLGYEDFSHMRKDPDLRSLHQDPHFLKIANQDTKTVI